MKPRTRTLLCVAGVILGAVFIEQAIHLNIHFSRQWSTLRQYGSNSSATTNEQATPPPTITNARRVCDLPLARFIPFIKYGTTTIDYTAATRSGAATNTMTVRYECKVLVLGTCSSEKFEQLATKNFDAWIQKRGLPHG